MTQVGAWTITWILFMGSQKCVYSICIYIYVYIYCIWFSWVKILDGIEYQHHTSLNKCMMAYLLTYIFWAFLKLKVGSNSPDMRSGFCRFPTFVFFLTLLHISYLIKVVTYDCLVSSRLLEFFSLDFNDIYTQTSNIRHTLIGNKIVDHSDVVGASPICPTISSFST